MRAALGALLVALALVVAGPAPLARAHADLVSTIPADGERLTAVPDEVLLTFSEDLLPDTVVVSVQDASGFVVRVLDLRVDGPDVYVTWPPGVSGADYTVNYRVVSQDGHPVEGSLAFAVDAPSATASPTPGSTSETPATTTAPEAGEPETSRAPLVAISVGLGVGIAAGFAFMLLRRRGGSAGSAGSAGPAGSS